MNNEQSTTNVIQNKANSKPIKANFEIPLPFELVAYWRLDETEGDIAYDRVAVVFGDAVWQPESGHVDGRCRFLRKTQKRFEVTFYPSPVQDDMHNHQNNKQSSQTKMDIAPFVPGHRPQVSYLFTDVLTTAASTEHSAAAPTAGRQNVLHNKAGNSQTQQIDKANDINNKI